MDVCVVKIDWHLDIPIATVYVRASGDMMRTCLLHRSFVQRYEIGIGSELQVSTEGCLIRVIQSSGDVVLPNTNTVFDRWFLFRRQLKPYISHGYARILFVNGIETLRELSNRRASVGQIRGIGPVTATRIQKMFDSMNR
jgi:hypothetical protein